jgi:predicted transcriptional regulator
MFYNQLRSPEMEVKIIINNIEVKIKGYDSIANLTRQLPDKKGWEEIYHEFAKSPSSDVRENITSKNNIGEETVKLLLDDISPIVLKRLTRNDKYRNIAEKDMLQKILKTQQKDLIENLSYNIKVFNEDNQEWLCSELLKQKDPGIRWKLACNWNTPLNILGELAKDNDDNVAAEAKDTLEQFVKHL